MRLEALDCAGPRALPRREVDVEEDKIEEENVRLQQVRRTYPNYETVNLAQVESISGKFSYALHSWWLQHGQVDLQGNEVWNMMVDTIGDLGEMEMSPQLCEFVFVEWLQEAMPDITARWLDGSAEKVAEEMLYKLAHEMDYMKLTVRETELTSRLRGLQRQRRKEDDALPHRPVRWGPTQRRGSNRAHHPTLRRYLDEDHWQERCEALQWENGVKPTETPIYAQPAGRPCFLLVHLFSGRRREHDYHDEVMRLADGLEFDVRVLSLDTAVHQDVGDLTAGRSTWQQVMRLAREGKLAGGLAGPPCETFTEARHFIPPEVPEAERKFWPRPLRSASRPWGLPELKEKELKQVRTGSRFALQMMWLMVAFLCYGGHFMMEHPWPPRDESQVSIFRTPIFQLLLKLPECALRIIRQQSWGAAAVKPTGIMTLRLPGFYKAMNLWKLVDMAAVEPAIGRNKDGSFKTAGLKEYPQRMSQGLAQCSVDTLKWLFRTGRWRHGEAPNCALLEWCEVALRATEKINLDATMLPDYQG